MFCFISSLAGCSIFRSGADGAPSYNVDVSKIPNAIPKAEPISRYGNPSSYVVNGHRYYVMRSAKGYKKRGMASWYGTKFHGHLTSTRETYRLTDMTAASTVLPLPTYAQVTNLENGRKVIVKVNDRGPFEKSRIMDLSYAAAKKLGYIGKGTAYVEVEAIDPRNWPYRKQTPNSYYTQKTSAPINYHHPVITGQSTQVATNKKVPNITNQIQNTQAQHVTVSQIYLQAGAFSNLESAKKLALDITNNFKLPTRVTGSKGQHPIYRVQIGPFANQDEELKNKAILESHGLPKLTTIYS